MSRSADLLPVVEYARAAASERKMKARRKRVEKAGSEATGQAEDAAKTLAEAVFAKTPAAPPPPGATIN